MLRKLSPVLVLLILPLTIVYLFYATMPQSGGSGEIPATEFSTERAFVHVTQLSAAPHFVGSRAHSSARNYIVDQFQELGLEVHTQEGYSLNKYGDFSFSRNILVRIPGTGTGNALLLMSHYDSAVHSSPGASDAASGVATILEGIRAFITQGEPHVNDIILLITDVEEVGLLGAELFMKKHPWANDVELALNFEARGSGGNSIMLLETNGGNAGLIEAFKNAGPQYPVTNSLAYSVYKMLPNDTDLTVLREQGNINGFNFAFIDDHYDYHTANDTPANLDPETLAHQGTYLMPLLDHFKDAPLDDLNAVEDYIYFNIPGGNIITYPFSWIFPLLLIALLGFIGLVSYGLHSRRLRLGSILKGSLPFLISLIGASLLVFLLWQFCLMMYPQYAEMEHGFTYNGYYYISGSVFLSLSVCFFMYHLFKQVEAKAEYVVFPIVFWLVICFLSAFFLKGASYFIIPVFFSLAQLAMMLYQKNPNPWIMYLLSLPALILLLPFLVSFPVALGLGIMFVTALLCVFLFSFFLPVFLYFRMKNALAFLCFLIFSVIFIAAHLKSDFTEERQKPNSLVYLLDIDKALATWNSYDKIADTWTATYFGEAPEMTEGSDDFSSKYGSHFTFKAPAPVVDIPQPGIVYKKLELTDSVGNENRFSLKIAASRKVHRMELFADRSIDFEDFSVNGQRADSVYLGSGRFHIFKNRWDHRLLTYHVSNRDTLHLEFSIKEEHPPEFTLYEASYDLLENPELDVSPRKKYMMPRPFVLNDAVIIKKTLRMVP